MGLGIGLLVVVLGFVIFSRSLRALETADPEVDFDWFTNGRLPTMPSAELVGRYLQRVRVHRWVGGLVGVLTSLAFGLSQSQVISIGIGQGSPFGDLFFGGVAGVLVGSAMAETYRLRPSHSTRSAGLRPRTAPDETHLILAVVALLAVGTSVLGIVSGSRITLALGVLAVAVVGIQALVLRRILERRSPVLTEDLVEVNEMVRDHAARRISLEALSTGVLVLGWQISYLRFLPLLPQLLMLLGTLGVAVFLLRRGRPYPPKAAK